MDKKESRQNPYTSPEEYVQPSRDEPALPPKPPFYDQAAKFSLYAPFILFLMNLCHPSRTNGKLDEADIQVAYVLAWIAILTIIAAFGLGVAGLVGGIAHRAIGTAIRAILGILLNGAMIYLAGSVMYLLWQPRL